MTCPIRVCVVLRSFTCRWPWTGQYIVPSFTTPKFIYVTKTTTFFLFHCLLTCLSTRKIFFQVDIIVTSAGGKTRVRRMTHGKKLPPPASDKTVYVMGLRWLQSILPTTTLRFSSIIYPRSGMANLKTQHTHVDKQPTIHKYVSTVLELVDMLAADKKKKRPWANKEVHKTFSIFSAVTMKITIFLDVTPCITRNLATHTWERPTRCTFFLIIYFT